MNILKSKEKIKDIIDKFSKYQKVMLLFDENVSGYQTLEIYNNIKEICIFNQSEVACLDECELNNGYKCVIYYCSTDSFLKLKFDRSEFVNIFVPTDNGFLPFCLNAHNYIDFENNYIVLKQDSIDTNIPTGIYFNRYYNYFTNLLTFQDNNLNYEFDNKFINQFNSLEMIINVEEDLEFVDINILKQTNLNYKNLSILHLILIDAILLMLQNIKSKSFMLVDIYKVCRDDDYTLLDKFYAMAHNESFVTLINLNYNSLYNLCLKTKEKILQCCVSDNVTSEELDIIFYNLKNYARSENNIISYLYLYNFFGV